MKTIKQDQLALSNFPYTHYSLEYALDSLERIGAKNIEFYPAGPHFYLDDVTSDDIRRVALLLKKHHLQVINVCPENCTYPINVASKNHQVRNRSIQYYVKALEAANAWESPYALCFPGFALYDETREEAWNRGRDAFAYLAQIAESYGVQLILESVVPKYTIINSSADQLTFMKEINSSALASMIDLTCLLGMHETIETAVETLGISNVKHIHFHDSLEVAPGDWSHRVPGEGTIDLAHIVHYLDDKGFTGHFGCEVFAPYEEEPEKSMIAYRDWFNKLLSE